MRKSRLILGLAVAAALVASWAGFDSGAHGQTQELADGVYAVVHTSMGPMVLKLEHERAPKTVENFVRLAEGTKEWTNPKTSAAEAAKPFYDGLVFHRIIDGFMIQGGCPLGNGMGGPGFKFEDEFHKELRHDAKGVLSMANSGPNTNGSQFFITLGPTPHLNNRHSVFGRVVAGESVLSAIGKVATNRGNNRPLTPVTLTKLEIVRIGAANQAYLRELDGDAAASAAESAAKLSELIAGVEAEVAALKEAQDAALAKEREANKKDVPAVAGEVDPARAPTAPAAGAAPEAVVGKYILVHYRGARGAAPTVYYDKEGAREVAGKIAALARVKGADFVKIAEQFSDSAQFELMIDKKRGAPPYVNGCFEVEVGQVSDPIETPIGFLVFFREKREVVACRHILVQWKGSERSRSDRSKEEAEARADEALDKAKGGADFETLAREYSDGPTGPEGGDLGEFTRANMVKPFADAAFDLEVGGISELVETPFGFHVIQRYK